ncbi:hypothetical protein PoB_003141000 [Plakobranchus ocellatus]|uniref:Uncharacterized protein n=1 Tax=Plakobranchus ocellatus TaxID=259542 RepID=A0AAV4ADR0_9GAST|nr:hypothetical protein PoB_003141000 [Plakobranchus ocellatus]
MSPLALTLFHSVCCTVASESALRSAGTLLSRVQAPPPAPWPDFVVGYAKISLTLLLFITLSLLPLPLFTNNNALTVPNEGLNASFFSFFCELMQPL